MKGRLPALLVALFGAAPAASGSTPASTTSDPFEMSLEQLMDVEITTASTFAQKKRDAPSAVTVITAEDIRDYGYRTLAEVLRSVRGVYITNDRVYDYFGVRGFSRAGDFNSRVLLLIDGRRVNDVLFDQAYIGTDALIDLEDVTRIEFVPGPGSALYGNNAFFGVINVFTQDGKDIGGARLAGGFGSFGTDRERVTLGTRFANGTDAIASASRLRSMGQETLFFPEFDDPATSFGRAHDLDDTATDRAFGKLRSGPVTVEGAYSDRVKGIPTAIFGSDFDRRAWNEDRQGFLEARYEDRLTRSWNMSARLHYGFYELNASLPFRGAESRTRDRAEWVGIEALATADWDTHKLVLGAEYQDDYRQDLLTFEIDPRVVRTDVEADNHRYGLLLQDEFMPFPSLLINAGLRYDYYSTFGGTVNPRVALVYKPWTDTAFKAIYGTAFRAPNVVQLSFESEGIIELPEDLEPETIETVELVAEYQPLRKLLLTATAFHYQIDDLIDVAVDPDEGTLVLVNRQGVMSHGIEIEGEYRFANSARLRTSYSFAYAKDDATDDLLRNSPQHLAKLNLSLPLRYEWLRAGIEGQYVGSRDSKSGQAGDYTVLNLTLTASTVLDHLDVSASVYNLLDDEYSDPASQDTRIDTIPQDGRTFRVWLTWHL